MLSYNNSRLSMSKDASFCLESQILLLNFEQEHNLDTQTLLSRKLKLKLPEIIYFCFN